MGSKPKAPPPPPPPATERSTEVMGAKRQQAKDARSRKGMMATLLAGETGGQRNPLRKTLLGGFRF